MSKRRKIAIAVLALAAAAGIAWAALVSLRETAPDTATARSIGQVDIGDSETVGLFSQDLSALEPGDAFTECTAAVLIDPQPGDAARTWFGPVSGGLADDVTVRVMIRNVAHGPMPVGNSVGPIPNDETTDCMPDSNYPTTAFTGTLAGLAAAHGSYADGVAWPGGDFVQIKLVLQLPAVVDGGDVSGQSATFSSTFENRAS